MKRVSRGAHQPEGFTRLELLTVVLIAVAMICLALPALAKGKSRSEATVCLEHQRRLTLAWQIYARDFQDRVINNFGVTETVQEIDRGTFQNWANNIMTWAPNGRAWFSQTNEVWLKAGAFGRYTAGDAELFECPADRFASPAMVRAGIARRLRSVSMNCFFGRFSVLPNDPTAKGRNWAFSDRRQFLKTTDCPKPEKTWLFLDEHPDSINDGYFLNNPTLNYWQDIVGSQHEGACGFSFADGHTELKHWAGTMSKYPVRFQYPITKAFDAAGKSDFQWWRERTGFIKLNGTPEWGY